MSKSDDKLQVRVFSAEWCGFCRMVKQYLDGKKVDYVEVNIEEQPDQATWLRETTGQAGIPIIFFGDEEFVVGFDRPKIDGLLREYKLV